MPDMVQMRSDNVMEGPKKGKTAGAAAPESEKTQAEVVSQVIQKIEEKLQARDFKPTVGDYIRLLQLKKDLKEEEPREVKVTWVEPSEEANASGE